MTSPHYFLTILGAIYLGKILYRFIEIIDHI